MFRILLEVPLSSCFKSRCYLMAVKLLLAVRKMVMYFVDFSAINQVIWVTFLYLFTIFIENPF